MPRPSAVRWPEPAFSVSSRCRSSPRRRAVTPTAPPEDDIIARTPRSRGSADEIGDDRKMIRGGHDIRMIDDVAARNAVGERLRHEHIVEAYVWIPRRQRVARGARVMHAVGVDVSGAEDR